MTISVDDVVRRPIRFTVDEAQAAADEWGFNCGPGALCAVLDMTPAELRPHLLDFERKGYTNPTLMRQVLNGLSVQYAWHVTGDACGTIPHLWPDHSLIRVQWGGRWTGPGVPMAARYRHTHWIACRHVGDGTVEIFDVNATCCGGWIDYPQWADQLVPWLLRECEPKADGRWWQTHRCVLANDCSEARL